MLRYVMLHYLMLHCFDNTLFDVALFNPIQDGGNKKAPLPVFLL